MIIRDFLPGDRETYYTMAKDFYSGDATLFTLPEENFRLAFDLGLKGSPLMRMVLLEDTDEKGKAFPVGYAHLAFSWSCEAGGTVCWLEELYIDDAFRGRGYGKAFMQWLLETYESSCARFRLEVCPKNAEVQRMYERAGYTILPYIQMSRPAKVEE